MLGPNGAGKSTCIRLVQGALQPNSGRVTLLGANVGDAAYQSARRRTGIVPQAPGMYTDLTCAEYLDLAHRLYGRGDLQRVVDVFGLGDELPKRLHQLSGGFQRRLVLAAALLGEPDVLLLDEPTVGLDPVAQHDVLAFLREAMQRDDRTTLLCTHNLAEAEALCQEVIILRHGKVRIQASLARAARPRQAAPATGRPPGLNPPARRPGRPRPDWRTRPQRWRPGVGRRPAAARPQPAARRCWTQASTSTPASPSKPA